MSNNDYLLNDVPWDDEKIVDREPEGGDGRHHFGFLRLYTLQVAKSFEAGNYLTIPGVQGGDYDDKNGKGLKMFKGWTPGGSQFLFVLVATKQDKDGNDYQVVKQFPSKVKKNDPHLWGDVVLPSLKKLSTSERGKMTSEGVWCEWDEIASGHTFEDDDGEEHDIKAWGNFTLHPNEASLQKANDGFFAQFNSEASNDTFSDSPYPFGWQDDIEANLNWAKKEAKEKGWGELSVVKELGLDSAKTANGEPVNVKLIVSEVLNKPEAMVNLSEDVVKGEVPF